MRRALILCVLAGCADDTTPPWQLAQERIVAVRATPARIVPGQTARLDALLAARDGTTRVVSPVAVGAPGAPAQLFLAVHYNLDHWEVNAPDDAKLAEARAELGLPDGAPVPLQLTLQFPGPLYAQKLVWLGDTHDNPALPVVTIDGVMAAAELTTAAPGAIALVIEVPDDHRVRWLTSCGELVDDDRARASLDLTRPCTGELVVVVRDERGGVVWRSWPLHAQ